MSDESVRVTLRRPQVHWLYKPASWGFSRAELRRNGFALLPDGRVGMTGTRESVAIHIREATRHAVRKVTARGTIADFDPDDLVAGVVEGLLGHLPVVER